ncbi:MAG: aldo/keto reductase [Solirubrobacteraceae bacterium]
MPPPLQIPSNPLGAGGPRLPRVALGCGNFGGVGSAPEFFGQGLSHGEALELMDAAWELGIRHFDTADAYGGGRSEEAIGAWIRSRRTRPSLTTKTFNRMAADGDQGLSPARVRRQFASSLERLGVDRVDVYLAHDFDRSVALTDTIAAFDEFRDAGHVVSYGVSNFDAAQLQQALDVGGSSAVQNGYSLLQRDDEADVIPLCARSGVGYIVFSPLCGGWLTGKYRRGSAYPFGSRMTQRPEPYVALATEETFDRLEWLERFSAKRGSSMAGTALAWLLADERITQVVVGPGRPEHLQPVREAIERPLTPDERRLVTEHFS